MIKRLILVLALVFQGCNSVFFYPEKEQLFDPRKIGLDYEPRIIEDGRGPKLYAWLLKAEGEAKGTVIHLHGNAQNISAHIASVYWLPREGYNVFTFDYRGYGASDGVPSFEGIHEDAKRVLSFVRSDPELSSSPLFLFGQSLGGAVAIYTGSLPEYKPLLSGIIVESAFQGYRTIARDKLSQSWISYPFSYPLSYLISDDFDPIEVVDKISPVPLLIIHPRDDEIVKSYHGEALYKAAGEPKEFWITELPGHIQTFQNENYRRNLIEKLADYSDARSNKG